MEKGKEILAMPSQSTTIPVRKADGSIIHMTSEEFAAYQETLKKQPSAASRTTPKPSRSQAVPSEAKVIPESFDRPQPSAASKPPSPPKPQAFVDNTTGKVETVRPAAAQAQPKPFKKDDVASPLEEEIKIDKNVSVKSPALTAPVDDTPLGPAAQAVELVLKKAGWATSPEVAKRLGSLIISRLKDVRTDPQFLVHAMTPTHRGGVGLSPDQAEKLLAAIQALLPQAAIGNQPTAPPKIESRELRAERRQPAVEGRKPIVHDIAPPPPVPSGVSMGPKEEFAALTVTDFLRLGATVPAALSRLKEKFDALKDESYLLFLEARDGWFESPLYHAYIDAVAAALKEKKKLTEVVPSKDGKGQLIMDVLKAVVEVNKYISV